MSNKIELIMNELSKIKNNNDLIKKSLNDSNDNIKELNDKIFNYLSNKKNQN